MNLMLNNSVLNPDDDDSVGTGDAPQIENWKEHVTQLEAYLDNFDYFTGKSVLNRQKLKFHQDYNRAKAIYHDDLILFPEIAQKAAKEKEKELKKAETAQSKELARQREKHFQETKRDQLMELFYRIYDETSRLTGQKTEFEKRSLELTAEREELIKQQEKIAASIYGSRSELNDQHAFNDQLNSSNVGREKNIF